MKINILDRLTNKYLHNNLVLATCLLLALSIPSLSYAQEKPEEDEDEIMTQMQEVERLIHEGPSIQQTSVGLTHAVDPQGTATSPPVVEPADKRLRTGAEDAEALVGFLRSVRASAASTEDC